MIFQIILTSITFCVFLIWKKWFSVKKNRQIPDWSGKLPIIGHSYRFMCDGQGLSRLFDDLAKESLAKDSAVMVDLGYRKVYAITDPEDCLTVSNACLGKDAVYNITKPLLGNGLIVSDVPLWKKHRRLLNPAFNQIVLNSFIPTFNSQAQLLVKQFAQNVGTLLDHEHLLKKNNLETICLTATGVGGVEYSELQAQYLAKYTAGLNSAAERFKRFWLHFDLIFNTTQLKKMQDECITVITALSNSILQKKKAELKRLDNGLQDNKGKAKPFIELILELGNETGCFTDEEVIEEVENIIVAGHDTSATILTYCFTLLGTYPEVQNKVYKEILHVFKNNIDYLDKDNLSKLIYTEAVIKETMRMYPIAPVIARHVDKPVKLKNYTLEPNNGCFIMISGINQHPMWGPDVNQFKPERWLDPATLPDQNYFGAFGLGRRSCIGKVYAMMSMKVTIAHVLRQYKISADVSNMRLKWELMSKPLSGHEITLQLRESC